MNIAIATPEFVSEKIFDGGLANYTYKLAKWLISQGHTITVYLTVEENQNAEELQFENIKVIKISNKDYAWLTGYYLQRLKLGFLYSDKLKYKIKFWQRSFAVNKKIKEDNKIKKIDIIHYPHLGGFAYHKPKRTPSIVRISSSTDLCRKMGGYGSSDLQIDIQVKFELDAMKKADRVFGPSKMIAGMTEPQINKSISIIETPYIKPLGEMDNSIFETTLKGKKYILFFGSISLIKGVGTIAKMIKPLLEKHKDLYFVFVGKQISNMINGIDLWDHLLSNAGDDKNRIIYISSQQHQTLFPIIQNAELITLPSLTDNFPNTCIESMANKKIVIGTKGNGFDQLIEDGKNGFIVEVDDHNALLKTIDNVLKLDSNTKKEIENKAAQRIEKLHPDIVLNQLLDLYKEIINEYKN